MSRVARALPAGSRAAPACSAAFAAPACSAAFAAPACSAAFAAVACVVVAALASWGCRQLDAPPGAGAALASAAPSPPLPLDPQVVTGQLRNGLSYLLRPTPNTGNSLQLELAVRVGSLAESEDERGFAHLLEHVAYDDAQRFAGVAPVEFLQRIGAVFGADANATTSHFATVYRLNLPAVDAALLDQGLTVARGWAGAVRFDWAAVERQRQNVLSEQRTRGDARKSMPGLAQLRAAAGTRLPERDPLGTEATVQAATPEQLAHFYQRWYRPEQMAVIAVGELDPADLVRRLELQFADLPSAPAAPELPRAELPQRWDEWTLSEASEWGRTASAVLLVWRLPAVALGSEQGFRNVLVDRCLCQMLQARLRQLSEQADAGFAVASCHSGTGLDGASMLALTADARSGRLRQVTETVLVELQRARQHGFLPAELERAKASVLANATQELTARQTGAMSDTLHRLEQHFLFGAPVLASEQEQALVERLLREFDLAAAGQRLAEWSEQGRRSLDVLRAADPSLSSSAELGELVHAVRGRALAPPVEHAAAEPLLSELPRPGRIIGSERITELNLRVWTLENGARVAFRPGRRGTGQVLLRAMSPGGWARSPEAERWNAALSVTIVLDSGVAGHSHQALGRALEGTSVSVRPWLDKHSEGLRAAAPASGLSPLFQLLHLYVTQPRRDPRAFEVLLERFRQPLEPESSFKQEIARALYGGHPFLSRFLPPTEQLDLDRALSFYRDRFGNVSDFHFVIVGDIREEQLVPYVEEYLASLPGSPRDDAAKQVLPPLARGVQHVRVSGRPGQESRVVLSFARHASYSAEADVDLEALAGYLELRLRDVLREQLGGIYSAMVYPGWLPDEARLTIQFDCRPADVEALKQATFAVLAELESAPHEGLLEILRAQRSARVSRVLLHDDFWADSLALALRNGADPRLILQQPSLTSRITGQQLRQAARRYLSRDQLVAAVWSP